MFLPDKDLIDSLLRLSYSATKEDVLKAINSSSLSIKRLSLLIAPIVLKDRTLLKLISYKAFDLTRKRFGFAISLYIPLYFSNYCINGCIYCGFNAKNSVKRIHLSYEEILKEADAIRAKGFKKILLVAGEHPMSSDIDFLKSVIKALHLKGFSCVSIEIAPLSQEDYRILVDEAHLDGLYIYQETYNRDVYDKVHLFGRKKDYMYRLETPERGAKAGIPKIGLGVLLGLNDWREDILYLAQHIFYLQSYFWQTEYSISFPRIRPAEGIFDGYKEVSDAEFINIATALRLVFPEVGMSLSTRETSEFRDRILPLVFTNMSAGSSTSPGGYTRKDNSLEQFEVEDTRSPYEVALALKRKGFDPVWKDWE